MNRGSLLKYSTCWRDTILAVDIIISPSAGEKRKDISFHRGENGSAEAMTAGPKPGDPYGSNYCLREGVAKISIIGAGMTDNRAWRPPRYFESLYSANVSHQDDLQRPESELPYSSRKANKCRGNRRVRLI